MSIQQLMLGVGAKKKTYMEDLFNTDLWTGDGATHQVVNNINLSGDGGMVWMKSRSHNNNHLLADTVRGSNKVIFPDGTAVEQTSTGYFTSFNSNGFTTGDSSYVYESGKEMAGWSFKKAKGFFDVVTWTGDGTNNRSISHQLGSVPGMIIVKVRSTTDNWLVWHKDLTGSNLLMLDSDSGESGQTGLGNSPTSTTFTVNSNDKGNGDGETYVAYLFAGGESTAATARSVAFDGDTDELVIDNNNGFDFGDNDFTIECWVNPTDIAYTSYYKRMWSFGSADNNSMTLNVTDTGMVEFRINNSGVISTTARDLPKGTWTHLALVRHSNNIKLYINGIQSAASYGISGTLDWSQAGEDLHIGTQVGNDSSSWNGKISNFRIVKGTAVYTTAFVPSTTPLTNISNTVLLCCNNSSVTGSTVTPGTINTSGSPTASTDSPFDDPNAFTFGENEDQNVIKSGKYIGNGQPYDQFIYLGWEPQWLMVKNISTNGTGWTILDNMRGIITDQNEYELYADTNAAETNSNGNRIALTSTGFRINNDASYFNTNNDTYIYCAIRRPDGYCGKPIDAGTDVFNITAGGSTVYSSGFPVDYAFYKNITTNEHWYTSARLIQGKEQKLNSTEAISTWTGAVFDSNDSWGSSVQNSDHRSWMFKRHKGFDAITYKGTGLSDGQSIPHSLNAVPEMMWVKRLNDTENWTVYHKGLNGGTNPEQYYIPLNSTDAENSSSSRWQQTAPTSTHFTVGDANATNKSGDSYLALLFSSVDKISKLGYYTGNGSTGQTITLGFQPRFVLIRRVNATQYWTILDTNRGWGSGNDAELYLNEASSGNSTAAGEPTSTGFTLTNESANLNTNNDKYIYYAHA